MKKEKQPKTNAIRLLDKAKVAYQLHEYAWSEDHSDNHTSLEETDSTRQRLFKTIVTIGDKTGVVVACIPGKSEINLKALARVSGNKKMELLHLNDLEKTTGYIRGGCSPIGMKKIFPTYLSEQTKDLATLIVSAGRRGFQVELAPEDLRQLVKAEYADIEA